MKVYALQARSSEADNNPCNDLPADFCKNGGLCYVDETKNDFTCQCRFGYDGTYCEEVSGMYCCISVLGFLIKCVKNIFFTKHKQNC